MKNVLKFVKKYSTLILFILFVLLITVYVILAGMFITKTDGNVYGNRLDGIEKHPFTKEVETDILKSIEGTEKSTKATINITGKIIKIDIKVKDEVSMDDAKTIYDSFKENITEDIASYYDITVILENTNYTSFGYRKAGKEELKWTNNKE